MTDSKKLLKMKQFKSFWPTHACTIPPGGLSPNQAQAASPMVCGWRLCTWFGCRRAIGDGRGQSRRPPWFAGNDFRVLKQALKNSLPQHVEVRYSSTYVEEKKGRFRTSFNRPSTPKFGQPSRVAPAGRAPRAQWKKKELR